MDKKIILGYTRRLLAIIPSIFFCALGVALLVSPEWGSDPLTTFEIGLSNVFHVQLGTAALVFEGIVFFVFLIIRRDLVHLGTLAWCFLIGPFENVSYCILFALGVFMGASWGIGTLIAVFVYGPVIDQLLPYFKPYTYKIAGMTDEKDD